MKLLERAVARLPGSVFRGFGNTATLGFEVDGCWLEARARATPALEIAIPTVEIAGFSLRIEPNGDLFAVPMQRDVVAELAAARMMLSVHQHYDITCADPVLEALWLDLPARTALVEALAPVRRDGLLRSGAIAVGHDYRVAGGEVRVRRREVPTIEQIERALIAGGMLATRPQRMDRTWREVARALGGTTTADRWEIGGAYAVTIDRAPATVRIDNLCVLPGERAGDSALRTRARARRIGDDGDRWALWPPALARKHRPDRGGLDRVGDLPAPIGEFWKCAATAPPRLRERLRPLVNLLLDASPAVAATVDDEISLWWPGLVTDVAQLAPAVELVARLAVALGGATGPYR